MNIVIIEDEPAIARNLEFLIKEIDDNIQIINKLTSVKEAVKWLKTHQDNCHLLFMDIKLSDGLSFEIFETISPHVPIVFITAYEDYALEAFKTNAIDYILKPFEKEDLKKALNKFKNLSKTNMSQVQVLELFKSINEKVFKQDYKKSYLVHYKSKLIPLGVNTINWFYTEDEIVYAHTLEGEKHTIDSSLEKIYAEINPSNFFRANRQFIIQRKSIKDIDFYFNGRLIINVIPKPHTKIIVSKARAHIFKRWMNN